jgi:hypothetical protein
LAQRLLATLGSVRIDAIAALVVLSSLVGACIRFSYVLTADFPLNDGGLFYAMTHDIQDAGYSLPSITSYNGLDIPFAYPPFGFYVAAAIDDLTALNLLDVFRFLPVVVTCLTVPAFYLLARSLLDSRLVAGIAVLAFALVPRAFVWLLMGGGITRSFGLLFALLALQQAVLLFRTGRPRYAVSAGALSGLTVLSHLETGFFLAFSLAFLFVALGAYRQGIEKTALVAAIAGVMTLPWLVAVLANNGTGPLLAAQGTGGSIFSGHEERIASLTGLLQFISTSEPLFPVIGVLAVLGGLVSVLSRRFLLVGWWALIIVLDLRAYPTFTMVPVAMLAGVGLVEVVLPAAKAAAESHGGTRRPSLTLGLTAAFFAVYISGRLFLASPSQLGELTSLSSLARDERVAMTWVAESTPASSRFLIIPESSWETARTSEWFPVLAERTSVATVQGSEWLARGSFDSQVHAYYTAYECGYGTAECLQEWLLAGYPEFSHVYFAKSPWQCCSTLINSLLSVSDYELVYDGRGATIFARRLLPQDGEPATLKPISQWDTSGLP